MKKYAICPGYVFSSDGDRHFIGAGQLMDLYRVSPRECVIVHNDEFGIGGQHENLIRLYPSFSGNYTIPKVKI